MTQSTILVTGGAGFIGSALVRHLIKNTNYKVVNVDKLTYAGHLESVEGVAKSDRYTFIQADICDLPALEKAFQVVQPHYVMHLAAESHVDRSVEGPAAFLQTNVVGTCNMLTAAQNYWMKMNAERKKEFRFLHISTDEVFGTLGDSGKFTETTPYAPNSPYSASKAASDHFVRAWHHTYGFPTIMTNCSNNYGPYQFPEKLIPVVINSCLAERPIPVYGNGKNVRDWLFVDDHVTGLMLALERGRLGESYNIGGHGERHNLQIVESICQILNELRPRTNGKYQDLISFVKDRPGHDWRYAIDATKIETELGWKPKESFETGIRKTVEWYVENQMWCERVVANAAQRSGKK